MRPVTRLVLAAAMIAAGPLLSACDSLDALDMFDSKKKLTGDRRPVFPEGVPGVVSGVPPELVRGYREPDGGLTDPARAAAAAAADTGSAKPKPQRTASKPKPKPSSDPDQSAADRSAQGAPAAWPSQQQQPQQSAWPGSR